MTTFRAGPTSVPEPDFGVVPEGTGRVLDTGESVLLVEVSDTSLSTDRRRKRGIYARTGAPCYWIVEIPKRQVRVLTDPRDGDYRSEEIVPEAAALRLPVIGKEIPVAGLLPTR
jgi:Uma2 family endonuclease